MHHSVAEPAAYMQDVDSFMTTAFFHGLFEDLPELRTAIAHAGTTWVPLALENCETYLWLGVMGGVPVCLEPEECRDRHPILTSFDSWERPVARTWTGSATRLPGAPGTRNTTPARPRRHVDMLESEGVDQSTIDRLLGGHAANIFRLPYRSRENGRADDTARRAVRPTADFRRAPNLDRATPRGQSFS